MGSTRALVTLIPLVCILHHQRISRLLEVLHPASKATAILITTIVNLNTIKACIDQHLNVLLICLLAKHFFAAQLTLVHAVAVVVIPPHFDFLSMPIFNKSFEVRENRFVHKRSAILSVEALLIARVACLPAIINTNTIVAKVQQGRRNTIHFVISRGNSIHN